jgi:penicillin-binding protein 2
LERLRDFDSVRIEDEKRRLGLVMLVVLGIFGLLLLRLWYMQIISGGDYRRMSENNRVRVRDIPPCRGLLYDRNGVLLVDNRPCFDLCLVPEEAEDDDATLKRLAAVTGRPVAELKERLEAASGRPSFLPVMLVPDAGRDLVAKVEMHLEDLPGVIVQVRPRRIYLEPGLAPHLLGYLGEAALKDLEHDRRLLSGDFVGKYGIEMAAQPVLAGVHGQRRIEVDACGREIRGLEEVKPDPGTSMRLTIDANMQRAAEEGLEGKAGAVAAMDVNTGEVLALISAPAFDPNSFVDGLKADVWKGLRDDPRHPLHNRALQGAYPPGSTFKMIVALAGLQEGVITPQTAFNCPGGYSFGGRTYHCWREHGHGTVSLHRALVESCDVYFYRVGQALGVDRLAVWAEAFGLGRPSGLGLGTEVSGTVPGRRGKLRKAGKGWLPGETLSASIGQGFNTATPVQMLTVVSAVANGGKVVRPQVVKAVEGADGRLRNVLQPVVVGRVAASEENFRLVREALAGVVAEPGGTGGAARSKFISIGGKTGTAQVVKLPGGQRGQALPERYRDHAWFVAFAPADAPKVAVAVLVEHGGHGGSAAAPIAKAVIEAAARGGYFGPIPGVFPPPPPAPAPAPAGALQVQQGGPSAPGPSAQPGVRPAAAQAPPYTHPASGYVAPQGQAPRQRPAPPPQRPLPQPLPRPAAQRTAPPPPVKPPAPVAAEPPGD